MQVEVIQDAISFCKKRRLDPYFRPHIIRTEKQ